MYYKISKFYLNKKSREKKNENDIKRIYKVFFVYFYLFFAMLHNIWDLSFPTSTASMLPQWKHEFLAAWPTRARPVSFE